MIKGKTLNAKYQSGNTGFGDVTRDGGMANGREVEDQRIDLSTKSIIITTVSHNANFIKPYRDPEHL